MPRRNNRWDSHQSLGDLIGPGDTHTCEPVPTRIGHVCLICGRGVLNPHQPETVRRWAR
jgi:hypothetical protein